MIAAAAPTQVSSGAVPFDYSFGPRASAGGDIGLGLSGSVGNVVRGFLTISVEAPFVAASIGYGVVPALPPVRFGPTLAEVIGAAAAALPNATCSLADISVAMVLTAARRAVSAFDAPGLQLRLNPAVTGAVASAGGTRAFGPQTLARLFQIDSGTPADVQFLYALFDEANGRQFQNDPVLSVAGLGSADGDRPFRTFPSPITFAPRSTVRLEVTELSATPGTLFVTLHGYKSVAALVAGAPRRRTPRPFRR